MLTEPSLLPLVLFAMILPGQVFRGPPGMLVADLFVAVVDGVVVVVPVEDGQLAPLAAYPRSARNSRKMMKPKRVSVESSAMLCLDQYRAKHFLAMLCLIKRPANHLLALLCVD